MNGFSLGSAFHLGILVAVAVLGTSVGFALRKKRLPLRTIPALGLTIAVSEAIWYWHLLTGDWPVWPGMLPLHLCDITVWLTVYAAVRISPRVFGVAYYWGLAGTTMALLTPDVQGLSWSYPTVQFFVSHGLVVATLLATALSQSVPIERRSWLSAFAILQAYAVTMGLFNAIFGTNYLYLMSKPSGSSLLDHFGPWPWYLLVADVFGAVLFMLLAIPLKGRRPVDPSVAEASDHF